MTDWGEGQIDRRTDGWTGTWTVGQKDGWMDGGMDRQTDIQNGPIDITMAVGSKEIYNGCGIKTDV